MKFKNTKTSIDRTLNVVADARRREILHYLAEGTNTVTSMNEVVRYLHAQERGTGTEPAPTVEQLETELRHRHVPLLAEHGLIEYDMRSGRIQYHPDGTTEDLLECVRDLR